MAVAPTNSYSPTIDRIVHRAMIRTGLHSPSDDFSEPQHTDAVQNCREHLHETLMSLIADGVELRFRQFRNLQLVADQYEYNMASDVLDVLGDMKYIDPGEDVTRASGEVLVRMVPMSHWNITSSKSATGLPTQVFVYREGATIRLRFWPIPDEAGVVRYQAHVKPADSVYGQYDVDLEPYWHEYLTTSVAAKYALDAGLDQKAPVLVALAQQAKDPALAKSKEGTSLYFYPEIDQGWRRK